MATDQVLDSSSVFHGRLLKLDMNNVWTVKVSVPSMSGGTHYSSCCGRPHNGDPPN